MDLHTDMFAVLHTDPRAGLFDPPSPASPVRSHFETATNFARQERQVLKVRPYGGCFFECV